MTETILVVDDEATVLKLLAETLHHYGYLVLQAASARQAVEVVSSRAGNIDLLLADVMMPVMGGGELAQKICPEHPNMRVIFMSGYVESPHIFKVRQSRAKFLAKPFTPATLRRVIRESLDGPWDGLGL